jgi:hypothetical protein
MNPIAILLGSAFLILSLFNGYTVWFKANEYVHRNQNLRRRYRKFLFFTPEVFLFNFYNRNAKLEIVLARIASLIFIVGAIVVIVVGIRGPFQSR